MSIASAAQAPGSASTRRMSSTTRGLSSVDGSRGRGPMSPENTVAASSTRWFRKRSGGASAGTLGMGAASARCASAKPQSPKVGTCT